MKENSFLPEIHSLIITALEEDVKDGDHTSLACVSENTQNSAQLIVKDTGVIAGVEVAQIIFQQVDLTLTLDIKLPDGSAVRKGYVAFTVSGRSRSILKAERLVLNCMQRMSGIATKTRAFVDKLIIQHKGKVIQETNPLRGI